MSSAPAQRRPGALSFIASATVWLATAAGCAVAPATLPPHALPSIPTAWARELPLRTEPLSQGWRIFGDALLVELVDAAAEANNDVRSAEANLRRARALREQSAASLKPTLTGGASALHSRPAQGAAGDSFELGLDASWELDIFGQGRHGLAAAEADVRAQAAALAAVQVSVAAEVALNYLQMRGFEERLRIVQSHIAAYEGTLRLAQQRERAGLVSATDIERFRSALAQLRAQQAALAGEAARQRHALAVLTARPVAQIDATMAPSRALPEAPAAFALDTPLATLQRRPDVREAEEQLLAAIDRLGQEQAARFANPRLASSLSWSALTLGSLGSGGAAASLLANLAQPLFDGGQRDARIAALQAGVDAAQAKLHGRAAGALRDVEDALAQLGAAEARITSLDEAARAEDLALNLVRNRYEAGLADGLALLDAQRTLLQVLDQWTLARIDRALAQVRLYKALGGGWKT